ncbi:hypothetical protein C8R43DRAFT_259174 [Mycena crocata]|nr:hypothetical protein C8R43DRAFT_259174 [Mycena crocata]
MGPHPRSTTTESASLPPINILFAEVLQRQLAEPSAPPVRRPSAWPGFPGPDRNALLTSGYPHKSPPPPLKVGRTASAGDALSSPSMFTRTRSRDGHSQSDRNSRRMSHPYAAAEMRQDREWENLKAGKRHNSDETSQPPEAFRPRPGPASWVDSFTNRPPPPAQTPQRETERLPPIVRPSTHPHSIPTQATPQAMTPTGSPRVYNRDGAGPRPRDPTCHPCAMDQHIDDRRAAVFARGPTFPDSSHAPKPQIPTPLPPAHGHTMIPFQPTPSAPGRAFGVSMADILDFRPCLTDPDTPVLDNNMGQVFLTLEAKGYTTTVQSISGNCPHRRITRFNLAYAVASAFDAFLKDFPFNPTGLKAAAIVVRSVTELRLVNLYSKDGRVWRVHVAYEVV